MKNYLTKGVFLVFLFYYILKGIGLFYAGISVECFIKESVSSVKCPADHKIYFNFYDYFGGF